jgi:glycosyltransferase involved in cell wall biosynthesis
LKNRPTLAVAIITYNEEEDIGDCLASVTDFVDEIVVVDSFSTDTTEQICRSNPKVKFFQHLFDGHIQQKNRALEKCTTEWVLCIDADERVSPELRQSIEVFLEGSPPVNGAKFPRLTYHLGRYIRHGGWYPNRRYRLVRKGRAYWGGENPHDHLFVEGKTSILKGDLIHLSFKDLSDHVNDLNSLSSITAFTRCKKGKHYALWRLLLKPLSKLIEFYIFKRGFLDGAQGWIIAVSSAYSSFLREAKLFELDRLDLNKPSNLPPHYQ